MKSPIPAIVGFVLILFCVYGIYASEAHDMETHLRTQYATMNHDYFDDKLPEAVIHYAPAPERNDVIGLTIHSQTGPIIYIVPKYNLVVEQADETLFHEGCHISVNDFDHGPAWQNCMKSLADRGAFEKIW